MNLPTLDKISATTQQVATKSAMNPILWVCGLTTPFSIIAAAYSSPPLSYFFFLLAGSPIAYAIRAYDFWMKNNPDRLQSERYLLQRQIVGTMGKKSDGGAFEINMPTQAILIDNPEIDAGEAK
jgi:hypothetical protein